MKSDIQLISLKCLKCGQPLPAATNTLVLYCAGCGSAFEVSQRQQPSAVQVYFARYSKNASQFQCFWAFNATLGIAKREAKGGFFKAPKGLMRLFEERQGLRFYVSADLKDLASKDPLGLQLTRDQPQLEFLHYQSILPNVEISQEDAKKIADYLLVTSEAGQSDTLRSLEYQLQLTDPMLIAIAL
jgi:hypothetical protein